MKNKSAYIMWLFMALFIMSMPSLVFAMEQRELSHEEIERQVGNFMSTVDLDKCDENGKTPLHLAAADANHSTLVARLSLIYGADPDAKDHNGDTPLHDAVIYDRVEMATALLDEGADINTRNLSWQTPLHHAAREGNVAMVSLLLARGARTDSADTHGRTPFDYAREDQIKTMLQ